MPSFWRTVFTGKDNQSGDVGRIIWVALSAALVSAEGWSVVHNHEPFNPIAFATACSAIMAAGATALGLKAKTEPEAAPAAQ